MALKYLYVPSGVQAEKAYGVLPNSENADFSSFSRGSAGSRVDKNGFINTGLGLGSEEVVNGSFSSDSNWTKGTGWSIANGVATYDGTGGSSAIFQTLPISINTMYEIKITVVSNEGTGTNTVEIGNYRVNNTHLDAGTYTFYGASTSGLFIIIYGRSGEELVIDNVSVREVTEVNTDVPRIDYTGGGCPSLLLEPTSTNYMIYSEDFSQSFYSKFNASISDYSEVSPQGTYNAKTITDSGAGGTGGCHINRYNLGGLLPSDGDYAYSIFAKKGTRKICRIEVGNLDGIPSAIVNFNLDTGEIVSTSGTAFNSKLIEPYKDGWYKLSTTLTISNKQHNQFIRFRLMADDGNGNLNLDGTNTMHFFGAQVEKQSYATSYIPNYGTAAGVTRSADDAGGTGDLSNVINSSEGVLYAEIAALADDYSIRSISLSDGSTSNFIMIEYSNTSNRLVFKTSTATFMQTFAYDITDNLKLAFKYKEDDFAMWVNGTEVLTDLIGSTFSSGTLNTLNFGDGGGGSDFYGKVKEIRIYDEALSDTELQELTTL